METGNLSIDDVIDKLNILKGVLVDPACASDKVRKVLEEMGFGVEIHNNAAYQICIFVNPCIDHRLRDEHYLTQIGYTLEEDELSGGYIFDGFFAMPCRCSTAPIKDLIEDFIDGWEPKRKANLKVDLCNELATTLVANFDIDNKSGSKGLIVDAVTNCLHKSLDGYTIVKTEDVYQ